LSLVTPPDPQPLTALATTRLVPLTRLDTAFHSAIPVEEHHVARPAVAEVRRLLTGVWDLAGLKTGGQRPFAVLVLDGVISQEVVLAGRANAQLLGAGDVIRPWDIVDAELPCRTRWTCLTAGSVALLDERFVTAARRWPDLMSVVFQRMADQHHDAARRTAIVALPRVEDRLLAMFWQLADRWGVVRPEGVVVRLDLTHELLGRLIGARRPTVTLALTTLATEGLVTRDGTSRWTLSPRSLEVLETVEAPAAGAMGASALDNALSG
jgi:CRP/FNR family transcriptional regulator, cyclic AMP receptor protein